LRLLFSIWLHFTRKSFSFNISNKLHFTSFFATHLNQKINSDKAGDKIKVERCLYGKEEKRASRTAVNSDSY